MKKNIIHKVQVEINTTSMATANAVKSTMDEIIHTQILPSVETILERFKHTLLQDESLQINTLNLDINIQRSQLESNMLLLEIEEQLERIMTKIQREKTVKKTDYFIPSGDKNQLNDVQYPLFQERSISTHAKQLESFFFFLKTGMKPWWISDSASMKAILEPEAIVPIATKDPVSFSRLLISEIHTSTTRKRFVEQFPDRVLIQLVSVAFSSASVPPAFLQQLNELPLLLKGLNTTVRATIWEVLLTQLLEVSEGKKTSDLASIVQPIIRSIRVKNAAVQEFEATWKTNVEPLIKWILLLRNENKTAIVAIRKEFMSQSDNGRAENVDASEESNMQKKSLSTKTETVNKPSSETKKTEQGPSESEQSAVSITKEGMLFEHAGLVLLSPFLKHLFTRIGLMDDKNQLTDRMMAAHVLHFVATGNEDPWEFDMTFEKYIAGIDFNEPLVKHCAISDTIKSEVKQLFQAVKDNWTPMQNSSDELLQHEYLQRPGKLIVDGQQHRLVMERKTQDILLDKLSWAISIVRFPWNKELLYVEW